MIRLNDIYNFIEVSTFKSLSLAALKLEVTQPALSESIGRLEKDLGIKLFYRTKSGISLTPNGRKTLEQLKKVQQLLQNFDGQQNDTNTTITLGCHQTVGSYFLPCFFQFLGKKIPEYKIQLKHDLSRNIQLEIQAGRIDIGVVVNPISNPGLIIKKIADDKICFWKSKKLKVQNQIIADLNLLQSQSIIQKWTKAPKKTLAVDGRDLIARLTDAGCGLGILPERIVNLLALDLTPVAGTPSYKDVFAIVHRPEFGKSTYEREIINAIRNAFL